MPPKNEASGVSGDGTETTVQYHDSDGASTSKDRRGAPRRSSPGASERPAKRMKRGKYISRACVSCQQRKVKGGDPCAQCIARSQQCVSARREGQDKHGIQGRARDAAQACRTSNVGDCVATSEVLARLAQVENRLSRMQEQGMTVTMKEGMPSTSPPVFQLPTPEKNHGLRSTPELQDVLETDGQSFAGELSMTPAYNDDRDRSTGYDNGCSSGDDGALPLLLPPSTPAVTGEEPGRKVRAWLESHLARHGLVADREEWRRYLQAFLDEVHIIHPFLHPPSLWETFNEVWEYSALWPMTSPEEREQKRLSVALLCFCLALGRCSISTRMSDADGLHSSGWSLFTAAISLVPEMLKMSNKCARSLLTLQILTLRVLYLFRLDATQRAARVLAVAISNAYMAGLHRQATYDAMPVTQSQLYCRTWWCIYIMDRRLAIESGRPFVIQDSNVDTAMPLDLDDDWLTRFSKRTDSAAGLQQEMATTAVGSATSVPYLIARVRFSRVIGKAWDLLYGVKASIMSSSAMIGYVDMALCDLLESLPNNLAYNPKLAHEDQFNNRQRFHAKQSLVLFMSTTFMRLLIRRPFRQEGKTTTNPVEDDELESLAVCASLASNIIDAHQGVRDDALKHCFPLCHYITSATMVLTGLVVRDPGLRRRYRGQMLAAARSLSTYCHTIWVSGKMMRWVSRLGLVVQRIHATGALAASGDAGKQGPRSRAYYVGDGYPADGVLQLTPQSDNALHLPQPSVTEHGTSGTLASASNVAGATHGRASDEQENTQQRVVRGAERGNPVDTPDTSESPGLALSSQWQMRGDDIDCQQLEDLPGWAMMDFNFEDIDKGDELGFGTIGGGLLAVADTGVRGTGDMPDNQNDCAVWPPGLEIGADQDLSDLFGATGDGV